MRGTLHKLINKVYQQGVSTRRFNKMHQQGVSTRCLNKLRQQNVSTRCINKVYQQINKNIYNNDEVNLVEFEWRPGGRLREESSLSDWSPESGREKERESLASGLSSENYSHSSWEDLKLSKSVCWLGWLDLNGGAESGVCYTLHTTHCVGVAYRRR